RTLLITGALDFAIGPLRPLFDDVVCARLATRPDGTYRGELTDVPPTGEARASALTEYAAEHGFDPAEGVAYADSTSDLPMLEAVGFPVAVNPETRRAAPAPQRGWAARAGRPCSPGCCPPTSGAATAPPRTDPPPGPEGAGGEGPRLLPPARPLRGRHGGRGPARVPVRPARRA